MTRTIGLIAIAFAIGCGAPANQTGGAATDKPGAQTEPPKPAEATSTSVSTATATSASQSPAETSLPSHHSMLVDDAEALPECVKDAEGWLVYVKADEQFMTCSDGEWTSVEIKGEKGETGEKGEAGEAGADGTDNRIVSSIFCGGTLSGTSISLKYAASLMASGDVFATASVSGGLNDISASAFYSAQQNGALDASVIVVSDYSGTANFGYWDIGLNRQTLVVTVTYNDVEVAGGQQSWQMTPDKCTVNDFD
jgi:hypothetical protein